MANYKHIFIDNNELDNFSKKRAPRKNKELIRDRHTHGNKIKELFESAINTSNELSNEEGKYITFESAEDHDIVINGLLDKRHNIKLMNTDTIIKDGKKIRTVTIFIPKGKENIFLKKINGYIEDDKINEKTGKTTIPHRELIESIENIYYAVIKSFFDEEEYDFIPKNDKKLFEIWINYDGDSKKALSEFKEKCKTLNIVLSKEALKFPEKIILLASINKDDIIKIIKNCNNISKFRKYNDIIQFLTSKNNQKIKEDIIKDLEKRTNFNKNTKVIVDILDTGINKDHSLIKKFLLMDNDSKREQDDLKGHGTKMAGVVLYNDLENFIDNDKKININQYIYNAKILYKEENDKELYGSITQRSVNNSEILNPEYNHIICMAVTNPESKIVGKSTSWSATIDKLCYGDDIDKKRLFFVSAGNVDDQQHDQYPEINKIESVEDPAQAFNAVTVGAYTEKYNISDENYTSYTSTAPKNCISPYTRTSVQFDNRWAIKPEILMEGGNSGKNENGDMVSIIEELATLTTSKDGYFDIINATSCATAKASWFAAQIQFHYPKAWPETIRALMIHSASWPNEMIKHLFPNFNNKKKEYKSLIRICGYGVPNYDKAINTVENYLTLISEKKLHHLKKRAEVLCIYMIYLFLKKNY